MEFDIIKLLQTVAVPSAIAIMVLKFLFKIIEKKFANEETMEQKNLEKNIEISNSVENVSKTIDRVSASQEKIVESQFQIVNLIKDVDRKINGRKF